MSLSLRTSAFFPFLLAFLFGTLPLRAGEPSANVENVDQLIVQLGDADATKAILACGKLIDLLSAEGTPHATAKKIGNTLRAHLKPEAATEQTTGVLLKVIAEKGATSFSGDIVMLVCRGDPSFFQPSVEALRELIRRGALSIHAQLIAVFKDPANPVEIRVRAIHAVNHLGCWQAIPDLIEARGEKRPRIASAAQRSLEGILGYAFAWDVEAWRAWWAENRSRGETDLVREAHRRLESETAEILAQKTNLAANIKGLGSGSQAVRREALRNIDQMRNPSTIDALLAYLNRESYTDLLVIAVGVLGDLAKTEEALKTEAVRRIAEKIVALLNEDAEVVFIRAGVEVLGKLGRVKDLNLVQPLIPFLAFDDARVRASAAASLGKIDGEEAAAAVAPLCRMLTSETEAAQTRREAANALGLIRDAAAVPALVRGLSDGDVNVRWSSANALGNIGNAAALQALLAAMKTEEEERVLEVLIRTFRDVQAPEALPAFALLVARRPTLADKIREAILHLAEKNPGIVPQAADLFAEAGAGDQAATLLRQRLAASPTDAGPLRAKLTALLERLGQWDEAAAEWIDRLAAEPGDATILDRTLRALGQIAEPGERGRRTAQALLRVPGHGQPLWEGPVRDFTDATDETLQPFFAGLRGAFRDVKPQDTLFLPLAEFVSHTDGRVAASAHRLLATWTGREVPPLAENAKPGVKGQAVAEWRAWWTANRTSFPFAR